MGHVLCCFGNGPASLVRKALKPTLYPGPLESDPMHHTGAAQVYPETKIDNWMSIMKFKDSFIIKVTVHTYMISYTNIAGLVEITS